MNYVATCQDEKVIGIFEDKETLQGFANMVSPAQVSYSEHETVEKATEFAEKLKEMTPWFDIRNYKLD